MENRSSKAESKRALIQLMPAIIYLFHPSYVDQLNQILHYLGTPSEDTLRRVGSPRVRRLLPTAVDRVLTVSQGSRLYSIPPHQAACTLLYIVPARQPDGYRFTSADAML